MADKNLLFLFLAILITSCTPKVAPVKHAISVIHNTQAGQPLPLGYCLPKNGIEVDVILRKENRFEGPYSKFALKYLGITSGIIHSDEVAYQIESISVKTISMADYNACFFIDENNIAPVSLSLFDDGTLAGVNEKNIELPISEHAATISFPKAVPEAIFTDLSTKRFVGTKSDAGGKTVKTDTAMIKVPVSRSAEAVKTIEVKAEEAANFIFKIRKRRLKMLASFSDQPVPANSADILSNELDSLETRYVELFTGRTIPEKEISTFRIFPEKPDSCILMFYFSPKNGISLSANNDSYSPVTVTFKPVVNQTLIPAPDTTYGLVYRNPQLTNAFITINDQYLFDIQLPVNQFGSWIVLNEKYLAGAEFSVEFYPATGAIKKVSKK